AKQVIATLQSDTNVYDSRELLLEGYVSDRIQHTREIILPILQYNGVVLCDRYRMSTDAFQTTQGISLDEVLKKQEHDGIITANITILLDVDPTIAKQRMSSRQGHDKFDGAPLTFHQQLREQYLALAKRPDAQQLY